VQGPTLCDIGAVAALAAALARFPGSRLRRRAIDRPAFDYWLEPANAGARAKRIRRPAVEEHCQNALSDSGWFTWG
jgi:hypothetical protein